MGRKSRGRQKIEIVKMKNHSNLQVTFSKRRAGLFKKASELSTLCGAEVAIVVFSPGNKVFSFGHPNVETLINKFMGNPEAHENNSAVQILEAHRNANLGQLNAQLMRLMNEVEIQQDNNDKLSKIMKARQNEIWWQKPVEQLNLNELGLLEDALKGLKNNVMNAIGKAMMIQSLNQQTIYAPNQQNIYPAGSSQAPVKSENIPYDSNIMLPTTYSPYNYNYGHGGFY